MRIKCSSLQIYSSLAAFLLFCSVAAAGDRTGSYPSGADAFSDMSRSRGQDYSESSTMRSDLEPYVADNTINEDLYKVGPGDLFQIFIESSSMEKQVNAEGNIVLGRIGVIHVDGLTLKEAKKQILDYLQTSHKRTNCFVNLSRPKTMRVFVTGAVNSPGEYAVPGNFRFSDALNAAQNFSTLAQKGDVQIQSTDGSVQLINIREFMLKGDLKSNPYLTQGCVIQVPFVNYEKPWLTVMRDSTSYVIQMEPRETAFDAILKAHSFYSPGPFSAVLVREKNEGDTLLSPSDAVSYQPKPRAIIEILSPKLGVYIAGAVGNPGPQIYRSDRKIIQYVSSAGLTTSSKVADKMEVFRRSTGQREFVSTQEVLQPGDIVYVRINSEQRFLIYTPILFSIVSLTLALLTLKGL